MNDDFYIGYLAKAPASLGKWIFRVTAGLLAAALGAGVALMLTQPPFSASKFEFGVERDYSGVIEAWPYPILRTNNASFLLIGPGKHGLAVNGLDGKTVSLKGSLIERAGERMLEVPPESLHETGVTPIQADAAPIELGPVILRGE